MFPERRRNRGQHYGVAGAGDQEVKNGTDGEEPDATAAITEKSPVADPLSIGLGGRSRSSNGGGGVLAASRPVPVRPVRHRLRAPQQLRGAQEVLLPGEGRWRRGGQEVGGGERVSRLAEDGEVIGTTTTTLAGKQSRLCPFAARFVFWQNNLSIDKEDLRRRGRGIKLTRAPNILSAICNLTPKV